MEITKKPLKLAVIGKGTAGSFALNHFAQYIDNVEINCYYDSNIKEQTVGEGTTVDVPETLYKQHGLEFHDIFEKLNGNFKTGINYIGWGKQDYMHTFPVPNVSMHFNAVKLQEMLQELNKDKVTFIDKNVSHNDIDADYIIDCSGKGIGNTSYNKAEYIPVNAAVVMQCAWTTPLYFHTLCIAAKHGWVFGIPLQDRTSFGYMYNKDINNKEEIEQELLEIIDSYGYTSYKTNHLKFDNYFKKINYKERVAYNGNASFFLEPMEATSIATIDDINRDIFDLLYNNRNLDYLNRRYNTWFKQVQDIITMHYLAGSKYNTEFWTHAKDLAVKCLDNKLDLYDNIIENITNPDYELYGNYGTWSLESFRQNIVGLGLLNKL